MSLNTLSVKKVPSLSLETGSAQETVDLAKKLAGFLKGGDWISLIGDLGTGKTVFVKGLAEALRCQDLVTSPSFSLIQNHPIKAIKKTNFLHHMDLYRVQPEDVPNFEWDDLMEDNVITVLEWADKAQAFWPKTCLPIYISHKEPDRRVFHFHVYGPRSQELIQKLKKKR